MKKIIGTILLLVVTLSLIQCTEDTVDFVATATLKGRVVEKGSFNPIENAKITLSPTNNTEFTDKNGYFTMTTIPVQEYSVNATKKGFLTAFQPVKLIADNTVKLVFELDVETALNKPPTAPELRNPIDGAKDLPTTVELGFKSTDPDKDEITYTIQVKNDFNTDIIEIKNSKDTLHTISDLKYGAKYFWQVAASDGINTSVLSKTSSFSITSRPNNRFLYVKKNTNNAIFSASGSSEQKPVNELQITQSDVNSWRPRKNRASGLIAFFKTYNNETHIFTMKPDGSEVTQVTSNVPVAGFNLNEVDFAWSSNGNRLIYPNFNKLYVIQKDGSGLREIYKTTNGNYITECTWSYDESKIAIKTNNMDGYNVEIYTIDMNGAIVDTILEDKKGAAGGIDFSIDGKKLLYTRDVSEYESASYRKLDSHLFIYDFASATSKDYSSGKTNGTNDLDPRFSPNEAEIIFVNTSNDGVSEQTIYKVNIGENTTRGLLFSNATMIDWE